MRLNMNVCKMSQAVAIKFKKHKIVNLAVKKDFQKSLKTKDNQQDLR